MSYELTGIVKVISDPQMFSSGFSKRELVVSVPDGNYTQDISLEFIKDKADLLNDLSLGEQVTVSFNIKGREYNGRYFNNLQGWKIHRQNQSKDESTSMNSMQQDTYPFDNDDIPF